MPLEKSATNEARERNIKREIEAGKPPAQAAAIGYAEQREARAGHFYEHQKHHAPEHEHAGKIMARHAKKSGS